MYRENYINSLRSEIVSMVAERLTPVALRYGYSDVALEANIRWRPQVLVLGNYSSGKSTLINEFIGTKVQETGQAPTDDSFTVITYDEDSDPQDPAQVTEQRDGKYLLNDPEFPFETLKKHGQRFASHFRLKKVNSPFLKNLAIIDTPGMLDSITERDRGYSYQEVIGDLAHSADLVLLLFDPHKAGTVREAHMSLRETLATRTFEDRILFVLNRIDECASLTDLLRVYGTLCWNLSQITGRKDIPTIHLTYSTRAGDGAKNGQSQDLAFLHDLENQREALKKAVLQAPRHRLDHLATYVETHGERLALLLEALMGYRKNFIQFVAKNLFMGVSLSLVGSVATIIALMAGGLIGGLPPHLLAAAGGVLAAVFFCIWMAVIYRHSRDVFHRKQLKKIDDLVETRTQTRRDTWENIRELALGYLKRTTGRFSFQDVKHEYAAVRQVCDAGTREIREALNELSAIRDDDLDTLESRPFRRKATLESGGDEPEQSPVT
jgi:EH domain-containing protein 1